MPKSAKLFRRSLQKSGVFFTPKKLAEYMRSFFPSDKAEIDPLKEQVAARAADLKRFRASLEFDALVCLLEHYRDGFNPLDFIDDLQNVLNEAKRKLAENGIHRKI